MGGIRIYTVMIAAVAVSGLVAMLPVVWSGSGVLSDSYRQTVTRMLENEADLFSLAFANDGADRSVERLRGFARQAAERTGSRYTVIAPDGRVVVDSEEDAGRMENHDNRPEVQAAFAGGTGITTRFSPTMGTDWLYVAVPFHDVGVVRAAAALSAMNDRLALWWKRAWTGIILSLAILTVMALVAARTLAKPIESAAAGAERYARGDLSYRLPVTGAAEVRRLIAAMGAMAEELDARFRLVNRQREEMRTVFETMSEGVFAVGDAGDIMLVNGAAQAILNIPDTSAGTGLEHIARSPDLLEAIRETAATDASSIREIRFENGDKREILVQAHTARLKEGGKALGVLVVLRDVTRLRHLENMRRDFVANVSHELRTPITTIQSCLETLQDDEPAGDGNEFLAMALRNTKRMGAIIDNLLFLAGMESGINAEAGRVVVTPVMPVIDEAVALCRDEAGSRGVTVTVECDRAMQASMNPQLVVHALVNLIDNAIKYGPENAAISVTGSRDGDRVHITVSDQGPGIPPRFQSRVFERFYRVDGPARGKKGSGLGLAIVKHIALSQGGDIHLHSEIGAGSRFTLTLPADTREA